MNARPAAIRIGLAVANDAPRIATLSRDAIEHGLGWSWTPSRVARSLRDPATNVVIAREGARMLGFAIMKYGDEEAHLLLLAVAAAHRRRGVGSALLAWLEATVRIAGMTSVHLEARKRNAAARAFYRHQAYDEVGILSGYYGSQEDAVRMVKTFRRKAPASDKHIEGDA
jgi:ribosomal-protein-alanine N-acetyltransferase